MTSTLRTFSVFLLALSLLGCPRTKRRTLMPAVPTSGDKEARIRFQEARASFERDGVRDAARFQAIAEEYPDDPVATYAHLYAGIAAFENGDYQTAKSELLTLDEQTDTDPRIRARGRLFQGMAETHLGDYQNAVKHLEEGQRGLSDDDSEKQRYTAYLAEAISHTDRRIESLAHYDRWFRRATDSEKAYIATRVQTVTDALSPEDADRAYARLRDKNGPVAAILGWRVATDLRANGDAQRARTIETAIAQQRTALGLPTSITGSAGAGDPNQIAAVLPITGRRSRVGEPPLRGLALAAGTFPGARADGAVPFHLAVHDTTSTAEGARSALEAVASDRSIAIVGPVDGKMVDAVAPLAHSRAVPLISLNLRSGRRARESSPYVFHIQLSAEDRAEQLARHAADRGVRKIAILRPDNGYGRAVGKAFQQAFEQRDGTIVKEVTYNPKATAFNGPIGKLGRGYDALFIPEQARRLALIAPALAADNLRVTPLAALERARERQRARRKKKKPPTGRPVGLLATAEFIDGRFVRNGARYCEGAVFAPGFFPDREDVLIRDFVDRFELAFDSLPTALDAYAYDAAMLVRQAVSDGAQSRADVASALAGLRLEGLTGTIEFDDKHRRADPGLLYTVKKRAGDHTIRAMR